MTYPVQVLREHVTALEAALSVCLADAEYKPVHKLRTETRRLEAQILLLSQLPEAPDHQKQAERLRRGLKRLRQAAGQVRDLDVQRARLDEIAEAAGQSNDSELKEVKGGNSRKGSQAKRGKISAETVAAGKLGEKAPSNGEAALRKGATELCDHLRSHRDDAAKDLQTLLRKRQARTAKAGESLLKSLDAADALPLAAEELVREAQAVFTRDGLLKKGAGAVEDLDTQELHTLRKAAKAARYLAETLPENAAAVTAASRFEALQEAGGQWHDALDLAQAARRHLGKGHELTVLLGRRRDENLESYREMLRAEAKPAKTEKPRSKRATASTAPSSAPSATPSAAPAAARHRPGRSSGAPRRAAA